MTLVMRRFVLHVLLIRVAVVRGILVVQENVEVRRWRPRMFRASAIRARRTDEVSANKVVVEN